MPMIRVEMFEGRTIEQKRNLVKAVTDCFIETCGGKHDQVHVIVDEVSQENWAVGGELFADK